MRTALLAGAGLLLAPLAQAQSLSNAQYQSGDAAAQTQVEIGTASDVGATAIASGNVVAAVSDDADAALDNSQHMDGAVNAETDALVWSASGAVAVTAAAVANGATANSANGDLAVTSEQRAHGDARAATHFAGGSAGDAATSASASGNVTAISVEYGELRLRSLHESTGAVSASAEADHCCVGGQAISAAIASANNLSVAGATATLLTVTAQRATGSAAARVDLYAGYAADASGNAAANANAVTIDNEWGYVNARIDQDSAANVTADSYVTLGGDFLGFASAGAYGVGNQAIVSNVGGDTVLDVAQSNAGEIAANAALAGEDGDMALASSAAYGNSLSASLCAYCDANVPSLTANSQQANSGNVIAAAAIEAPSAATIAATATAIGNAATFQVRGPGG